MQFLGENIYGHTKKVALFRQAIDEERRRLGRPLSIIDIGCGNGYAVSQFLPSEGDQYLGVDMHKESIQWAKDHYEHKNIRFECCQSEDLKPDRLYDVVVFSDVLEHVKEPVVLLEKSRDLIRSDGLLLTSIPNGHGPFELESAFAKTLVGRWMLAIVDFIAALLDKTVLKGVWTREIEKDPPNLPYNIDAGHIQFFRLSDISTMLDRNGFTVHSVRNLSFLSGPYSSYVFAPFKAMVRWNVKVASRLPFRFVSAWVLVARKKPDRDGMGC